MDIMQDKLSFIQKSLDMGEYDVVVKECSTLFEIALKRIFKEAIINLPFNERTEILECEKKIGKNNKGIQDFTFGELVGLFRESKIMNKWTKHSSRDLGLINSLDYAPIVNLRNQIIHEGASCSRYEAELVYNYLRNLLATLGFADLKSSISSSFTKKDYTETVEQKKNDNAKIFKYFPDRGLIINPSDGSRNVSLKVETINKIFDIIYQEIEKIADVQTARYILWKAGYESGRTFGGVMNNKWELEHNMSSINDKITKWCEFDSDVGWGKFINSLNVDEEQGEISGFLIISENFQNYNRGKDDRLICCFIKGYAEGVLGELLGGIGVESVCDMNICPKSNVFKKKCNFVIKVKGD